MHAHIRIRNRLTTGKFARSITYACCWGCPSKIGKYILIAPFLYEQQHNGFLLFGRFGWFMKFDATVFLLDLQICHLIFKSPLPVMKSCALCALKVLMCRPFVSLWPLHFTVKVYCVSKCWRKCEKHFISQDRLWCSIASFQRTQWMQLINEAFIEPLYQAASFFKKAIILIWSAVILKGSYEPINIFILFQPTQTVCL